MQPDPGLRDTETVPLKEVLENYMAREVVPNAPDAWLDHDKTKIGYEIPLVRHFYEYDPPRQTELVKSNLQALEREFADLMAEVTRGPSLTEGNTQESGRQIATKPAGFDWIGDVPDHWEIKKLKYLASTNDEVMSENEDPLREVLYVDIGSISPSKGMTTTEEMVFEDAPTRARRLVQDGDTIISTVRTYLRAVAPVQDPPPEMVVSTGFAVIRPRDVDSGYCSWALREHRFIEEVVAYSNGVSYPATNATQIGELSITVPPIDEQRAIAQYLDQRTTRIDELTERAEALIERLNEYRNALITAAVTGKIDVREPGSAAEPTE